MSKSAGRLLREAQMIEAYPKLVKALQQMRCAHEALMPGLRHIAVQDYALQNDAPVAAICLLQELGEKTR